MVGALSSKHYSILEKDLIYSEYLETGVPLTSHFSTSVPY